MQTVSVREVQHNLAAVLERVARGQAIAVTKRGRVIARIVPARAKAGRVQWPGSAERMKRLGREAAGGTPPSRVIREMRGERI